MWMMLREFNMQIHYMGSKQNTCEGERDMEKSAEEFQSSYLKKIYKEKKRHFNLNRC